MVTFFLYFSQPSAIEDFVGGATRISYPKQAALAFLDF